MTEGPARYWGKYRGSVINNIDPMKKGRIMAMVPDVLGSVPSGWALPCVPCGGIQMGFLAVPSINAGVWIEFEGGDPSYPIWVGAWWGSTAEVPALAQLTPPGLASFVMQTTLMNALMISDAPGPTGGILLKSASGASITINETGIIIQNGQGASIAMTGPTVTVNAGALTVT
jgi:uncharacterized protein involved in type VI secretion and phage assembly